MSKLLTQRVRDRSIVIVPVNLFIDRAGESNNLVSRNVPVTGVILGQCLALRVRGIINDDRASAAGSGCGVGDEKAGRLRNISKMTVNEMLRSQLKRTRRKARPVVIAEAQDRHKPRNNLTVTVSQFQHGESRD